MRKWNYNPAYSLMKMKLLHINSSKPKLTNNADNLDKLTKCVVVLQSVINQQQKNVHTGNDKRVSRIDLLSNKTSA